MFLKVVDIDPQGSIGPSNGSINSHGVEWGSLNNFWGLLGQRSLHFKIIVTVIGQGMQTAFFNKSTKLRGLIQSQLQ